MTDAYWFQKKWGREINSVSMDEMYRRITELEEKYNSLLLDVKRLEEENIEFRNEIYRFENSLESRIDIIIDHFGENSDV
jgi:protoporphyrinogen oxidase